MVVVMQGKPNGLLSCHEEAGRREEGRRCSCRAPPVNRVRICWRCPSGSSLCGPPPPTGPLPATGGARHGQCAGPGPGRAPAGSLCGRPDLVHQVRVPLLVRRDDRLFEGVAAGREVARARGERARHHNGRLDAEARQLGRVRHRERVHRCLGGEVRREVGRGAAPGRGGADPEHQVLTQRPAEPADTTSAMSRSAPRRFGGWVAIRAMVCSSLPSRNGAVAVGPGATALTVMSRPRIAGRDQCHGLDAPLVAACAL